MSSREADKTSMAEAATQRKSTFETAADKMEVHTPTGHSASNTSLRIIGIAGGIGAGKSVVSRILRLRGESVYDCDSEAKRLMDSSPSIKERMKETLGPTVINADGSICRPEVARIIFSDHSARRALDSIVHSEVLADVKRRAEAIAPRPLYVESAVMATSGLAKMMERVLLVTAPPAVRLQRAVARSNASPSDIQARMKAQEEEFRQLRASGVPITEIDNEGAFPLLLSIPRL